MLNVLTSSLLTSLGNTPETVTCAVEARINRFHGVDFIGDDGEPVLMATVPEQALPLLPPQISRKYRIHPKLFRMLSLATGALQSLDIANAHGERPALFLAGPDLTIAAGQLDHEFLKSLGVCCGMEFNDCSRTNNLGRAGIMDMADLAQRYMAATNARYAIIGAVDTYHDLISLQYLSQQNRLRPASADGCIPGEGAAFLLVSAQPDSPDEPNKNTLSIDRSYVTCRNNSEEALATAVGKACADSTLPARMLYTCINGELRFANQLAIAMARHRRFFTEDYEIIRVAECLGDLGAASGGVMLALAEQRIKKSNEKQSILICCASDNGTSAAMHLSHNPEIEGARHDTHRVCEQA